MKKQSSNNNNDMKKKKVLKKRQEEEDSSSSDSSASDNSSSSSDEEEEVVVTQKQPKKKKTDIKEKMTSPSNNKRAREEEEEDEEDSSSSDNSSDDDGSSENSSDEEEQEEKKKPTIDNTKKKQKSQDNKEETKVSTTAAASASNNKNLKKDDNKKSTTKKNDNNKDTNNNNSSSSVVTETTFQELGVCEPLVEACTTAGWKTATKIQKEVLPYALEGRDIIGLAETGSGKTGAFTLPLLQALLESPPQRGAVFGLILTPTRELAFQIHQVVQALSGTIGATSLCIVGGVDKTSQSIALARTPHVIIATPGRLVDHLTNTKGFHLRKLRYLVLDEADRMLSLDFEEELNQILDVIPDAQSGGRRTMLFSATMTSKVQKLQRASLTNPVKLEVSTKFQTPKQLLQSYLFIPAKYKDCYLTWLIHEHIGKSILVFGATCNNVQRLALMLRNLGFDGAVCLHGQMSQPKRLGALQKFTTGERNILICTDVASRGLDIPSVDVVINFDLPGHGKDYIHRVGRTARAGKSGKAIAMVTQYDVEVYQRLETLLGKKLPEYNLTADEETVLVLLERVNEAQRIATRELKEQLAARKNSSRDGGRRNRHRRGDDDNDVDGGDEGGLQNMIQKQLKKGYYAGGSGGRGGALPNQRGYSGGGKKNHKKQRR